MRHRVDGNMQSRVLIMFLILSKTPSYKGALQKGAIFKIQNDVEGIAKYDGLHMGRRKDNSNPVKK